MDKVPAHIPFGGASDAVSVGRWNGTNQLTIRVSTGSGTGGSHLAAFDAALFAAGVADYNLLRLSSVIPPHAVVREVPGSEQVQGVPGDVAYCVYAAGYASSPREQAWAGLAWAVDDRSGAGVFTEHTASSESAVRRDLDTTIEAMSRIRGSRYRPAGLIVSSAVCLDQPVCAVAMATYGTTGWRHLLNSEG